MLVILFFPSRQSEVKRIEVDFKDSNNKLLITQISSYTTFDNKNYEIIRQAISPDGNVIATSKETKKLEDLTERELELLELKK